MRVYHIRIIIKDPLMIGCDVVTGVNHRVCGSDQDSANVVTKVMTRKKFVENCGKSKFSYFVHV